MKAGATGGDQASVLALVMAPTGELALAADPEALRFGAPLGCRSVDVTSQGAHTPHPPTLHESEGRQGTEKGHADFGRRILIRIFSKLQSAFLELPF